MIINDKPALKKCIKQLIRHTRVSDAGMRFNLSDGDMGVLPMLSTFPGGKQLLEADAARVTPLCDDAVAMYAAFEALGISLQDVAEADAMQKSYTREAWIREVLDVMPAQTVLCEMSIDKSPDIDLLDNRILPVLSIPETFLVPGRYGLNYENEALRIAEMASRAGTQQIRAVGFNETFLRYCLLPLSEDQNLTLHLSLEGARSIERFINLFRHFPAAHCILEADAESELQLIDAAVFKSRILVCVNEPAHYTHAISRLGLRFHPLSSHAVLPEQMLGRWITKRDLLYMALYDHYIPLARAGIELDSDQLEKDVVQLLSGNLDPFIENL